MILSILMRCSSYSAFESSNVTGLSFDAILVWPSLGSFSYIPTIWSLWEANVGGEGGGNFTNVLNVKTIDTMTVAQ